MRKSKADQLAAGFGGSWLYLNGTCRWDCSDGRFVVLDEVEVSLITGEVESVFFYALVDGVDRCPIKFTGSKAMLVGE